MSSTTPKITLREFRVIEDLVVENIGNKRYLVAEKICKNTIEELERVRGHNDPKVARMQHHLANVYRHQNRFKCAASVLEDNLQILEKVFGKCHSSVIVTLNSLAELKSTEAKVLWSKALQLDQRISGEENLNVVNHLDNLAYLAWRAGEYEEAASHYEKALSICDTGVQINPAVVKKMKKNLASCYFQLGKYKHASRLYQQSQSQGSSEDRVTKRAAAAANQEFRSDNQPRQRLALAQRELKEQTEEAARGLGRVYLLQGKQQAARVMMNFVSEIEEK